MRAALPSLCSRLEILDISDPATLGLEPEIGLDRPRMRLNGILGRLDRQESTLFSSSASRTRWAKGEKFAVKSSISGIATTPLADARPRISAIFGPDLC